jgi:hypothetical protein
VFNILILVTFMATAFVGFHCCLKGDFLFPHHFMDVLPLARVSVCFPAVLDVPQYPSLCLPPLPLVPVSVGLSIFGSHVTRTLLKITVFWLVTP